MSIKNENDESLNEEKEFDKNKLIIDIYNGSLIEIKDIDKKIYFLMEQRNTLFRINKLIKIINNLDNKYKSILITKFYQWNNICIRIKYNAEYRIAIFIYKKFIKSKSRNKLA